MGCIHRHDIIKSEISHQYSQEELFKQSYKEDNIPKMNSLKNSFNNNKSNNIFYVSNNSNNSGSNVTSNNKINNCKIKDNTICSLISNDYFNNKYRLIGEIDNQENIEEYKIQLKSNPSIYRAMRKIKKNSSKKQNMKNEDNTVYEEVNLLKSINHNHICKLYECITTPNEYFLIMDYCKEGSLETKLKWSIKYSENQIKYLAFQLFSAVQYLNQNNYMHTDIKPINILIDEIVKNDKDEDLFNIKLLNFGSYGESIESNNINSLPYYIAPEIIDSKYDVTSDIWSIGVIIYQMFYGEVPFGGENIGEIYTNIKNAKISQTSSASLNLKDLLHLIFVKDCKERINVNKCLEHKWFFVGSKTPPETKILKKCLIEEINTDTKIINEEKNAKIYESKDYNEQEILKNINKGSNEITLRKTKKENSIDKRKLFKLSIHNGKRITRQVILRYGKKINNNQIHPLIRYMILYIKYYIRIYFQQDKEIIKLNNIYMKYKIEKKIQLFFNYINNSKKISFDYFYYKQNILDKNLSYTIKDQINNKEELFKILIKSKKNFIENNLKISFSKLRRSSVDEIKNIFKETNNINLYEIQKFKIYFNEIEYEMDKNKYKQIYLYSDFYKMLINSINKLYTQYLSNNISTNVESNYTNNTMYAKSKESIKNENSKENNDHNKEEGEDIIAVEEIIKISTKNKEKSIQNNKRESQNSLNINKKDIKNANIKKQYIDYNIDNKKNNEKVIENINNNNLDNKNNNIISKNKNNNENKNIKKAKNIKKDKIKNNKINNKNIKDKEDDDDDDNETEERKKDRNRFDPEKFLSIIGFS